MLRCYRTSTSCTLLVLCWFSCFSCFAVAVAQHHRCDQEELVQQVTVDFSTDGSGNSYSIGDTPTTLPLDISVTGFRRTGSGGAHGRNDLAITSNNGGLVINSNNNNKTNPIPFREGGSIKFRFGGDGGGMLGSIYQIHRVVVVKNRSDDKTVGRERDFGPKLVSRTRNGKRFEFQSPNQKSTPRTIMEPNNWVNIRGLRVNLYDDSVLSSIVVSLCRLPASSSSSPPPSPSSSSLASSLTSISPVRAPSANNIKQPAGNGNDGTQDAPSLQGHQSLVMIERQNVHGFGRSVAVNGNTMVVGSLGPADASLSSTAATRSWSSYVYVRDSQQTPWRLQQTLRADGSLPPLSSSPSSSTTGTAAVAGWNVVAMHSDPETGTTTIAMGVPGRVHVFVRPEGSTSWDKEAKLRAPATNPKADNDDKSNAWFGESVSIHGSVIAVGSPRRGGIGAVHVFQKGQTGRKTWKQIAKLAPSESSLVFPGANNRFGKLVSVRRNTVVVGQDFFTDDGPKPGLYVYVRSVRSGIWRMQAVLSAGDGIETGLLSGLAFDGKSVVVSGVDDAPGNHDRSIFVNVFERKEGFQTWRKQATLLEDGINRAISATSLAIRDDTIVAGSKPLEHQDSGEAIIFVRGKGETSWRVNTTIALETDGASSAFPSGVAISGSTVVVGAADKTISSSAGSGAVFAFRIAAER